MNDPRICTKRQSLKALNAAIDEYVEGYEQCGEDQDGRDAIHTPTDGERFMINDAIQGLLVDEDFLKAMKAWLES